jgi:uncharacterized damage-inducible protein DinB
MTSPSEIQPWFERRFSFTFPEFVHPELRARLHGTPARLEDATRGLPPAMLTARPDGTWSIQENAGHMLDLEVLWDGRLDDFLNGAAQLRAADLTNRATHDADHNAKPLEDILLAFRRSRHAFVARLDGLASFERTALHPRLEQPMRLVDHIYFIAEHDDHHLARIRELRRVLG